MCEKMTTLEKNGTFPIGKQPVRCKWFYTIKYKTNGSIKRYKARLAAKGYTQINDIDYLETFAPMEKMNSIRVLLSITTNKGWLLMQLNVKNAFLHGDLHEDVYMMLSLGFKIPNNKGKVYRLKSIVWTQTVSMGLV